MKEADDSPEVRLAPISVMLKYFQRARMDVIKPVNQGFKRLVLMVGLNEKSCVFG